MNKQELKKVAALYAKSVRWSEEDGAYVGTVHVLVGDCCHGDDPVKVYKECELIALECVEAAIRLNKKLPKPIKAEAPNLVPNVKAVRSLYGLSQKEFSVFLNISPKTLHKWEQGTSQPSGAARTLLIVAATNPKGVISAMSSRTELAKHIGVKVKRKVARDAARKVTRKVAKKSSGSRLPAKKAGGRSRKTSRA